MAKRVVGNYVFVSYSRSDGAFVNQLINDLQNSGLEVWIDKEGLKPGTPNFEAALRTALRSAFAVVLVASQNSRTSNYVQGELRIAEMYECPVFPVWASGDHYEECVPLQLIQTQYVDARGENYATAIRALTEALRAAKPETQVSQEPLPVELNFEPRNPYKGLRPFRESDQGDFFGRARLVESLVTAFKELADTKRLLAIVAPSGSGKSSVVMAGLLPRLKQGAVTDSERWIYLDPIVPGTHPLRSLSVTLANALPERSHRALLEDLTDPEGIGLHLLSAQLVQQPKQHVLLFVDQFEEIFTQTVSKEECRQFIALLVKAVTEPRGSFYVVLTMRADFYDRPMAAHPELAELLKSHQPILPMVTEDLRAVIESPASLSDVRIEFDTNLVGDLLFEVRDQAGALPLLEFTLDQLFARREGRRLTQTAYKAIGGLRGALREHAEETYKNLPSDEHRLMARALFTRLIQPGETEQDTTRRRASLEQLNMPSDDQTRVMREVAGAFVAARLLTADADTIEVSHEALIREWSRLTDWLRERREDIILQRAIAENAREWLRRNKPSDRLYRGTALAEAQAWRERNNMPTADEWAFIEASSSEQERLQHVEQERLERELQLAQEAASASERARIAEKARATRAQRAAAIAATVGVIAFMVFIVALVQVSNLQGISATSTIEQGRALVQVGLANTQIAEIQSTLTPVAVELTLLGVTLQAGSTQLANAGIALLQVQSIAETAQLQAQEGAATLTPIPMTLTAVGATLQAGEAAFSTASAAQFEAQSVAATAQAQSAALRAEIAAVPATLTAVVMEIEAGQARAEAFRLVSEGNALLQGEEGNAELAAMLSIRALNIEYLRLADDALVEASNRLFTDQLFGDHSTTMWYAALSPDGRLAVTSSDDGALRVWDTGNGMLLRTIPTASVAWSIVFSPDGQTLLGGFTNGTAVIYNTATGEKVREFSGHSGTVYSAAFSPDGTRIVTGSGDTTGIIWDVRTGRQLQTLEGHSNTIYNVAFSPDGNLVATGSRDTTAILWDANTGDLLFTLFGHTNAIYGVAFSPSGRFVLTGGDDDVARLWDVSTGRELRQLVGHTSGILNVAFSPDGRTVATVSRDRTARLWDIERRTEVRRLTGHTDSIWSVNFSQDGRYLITASSDGTTRLWYASLSIVPRQFLGHESEVLAVDISPDNRLVATGSDDNTVRIWDRGTSEQLALINHPNWVRSVNFSPDGRLLATASDDGTVRVWDVATTIAVISLGSNAGEIYSLAWSPDGSRIIAGYSGGRVIVWDVVTGEALYTLDTAADTVNAVAYAPDGSSFAAAGVDTIIRVWDAHTGEVLGALTGHSNAIYSIDYSPDSRTIVSGSSDNTIRKWDIATGSNTLRITGHTGTVWTTSFSDDNQYILSSSSDNTVRLWDAQTGEELRRFNGHTGTVWGAVISQDNRYVLTASRDGSARLWDVNIDDTVAYVCSRLGREFTATEREQFVIFDSQPTCPQFAPLPIAYIPTATPVTVQSPTFTLIPAFATEVADAAAADLAALATNRRSQRIFGPADGSLFHDPESQQVVQNTAPVNVSDFIVQASFIVPYNGSWDFAFFFRQNESGHYRVILDSDNNYSLIRYDASTGVLSDVLKSGTMTHWNRREGETNFVQLIVIGDKADLYTNGERVASFDVADQQTSGTVSIVTAAYSGYSQIGAITLYDNFTVWSLDEEPINVTSVPTWTPIPEYATLAAYSGTATVIAPTRVAEVRATAEAVIAGAVPIFGPMNGNLLHDSDGSNVAAQRALVQPADFVAEARFFNPYGRSRGDWDIAFFFRDNDEGGYRLVINSAQEWRLQTYVGEVESSLSGQLTNLDFTEGGSNLLRLVAQGDNGAFYLNDEFISELDLSANTAPGDFSVVTGAFTGYMVTGERTHFEGFTIWSPTNTLMTPTPMPEHVAAAQRNENAGELVIGTRDQWEYTARGGEIVDIYTQADWDTLMLLMASDGEILALNDDSVRGGLNSLIERFTFPVAGTYIIEVRGYDDVEGGAYSLWITDPPRATPTPSPQPTALPAGNAQVGANQGELQLGTVAAWTFEGRAGQIITLETQASWDTMITVRRATGMTLAANDDDARGGTNSYIENLVLPSSETYIIEVRGYNDAYGGVYTLRISEGR